MHVSVTVVLMKGENDHQLQCPFEHDVTCMILNWKRDENHVIKTVDFKTAPTKYKGGSHQKKRVNLGVIIVNSFPTLSYLMSMVLLKTPNTYKMIVYVCKC